MRAIVLGGLLFLTGCLATEQYLFYPEEANSRIGRHPAVTYALPLPGAEGEVQVASLGETEIRPGHGGKLEQVAVRLVVENDADAVPWAVDLRQVALTFAGDRPVGPIEAEIEGTSSRSPIVWVPRGQQRTIDLYFAVPPAELERRRQPGFDVTWQVQTGAGVVSRRTRFDRRTTSLRADEEGWAAKQRADDGEAWFGMWRD